GSGKARSSLANTSFSACTPVASTGNGVRISTSGSTMSSIVQQTVALRGCGEGKFEMSSASPVLVASWKRLNVALLLVSRGVDILASPRVDMNAAGREDMTGSRTVNAGP